MKGVDVETRGNTATSVNTGSLNGNVETKGNRSTDLNSYSFNVSVEVPGKRIILP